MVCGLTTLELDHTAVLGESIESIAWHKAGIFKEGGIAIVAKQTEEAMKVIRARAKEKNVMYMKTSTHFFVYCPQTMNSAVLHIDFSYCTYLYPRECRRIKVSGMRNDGLIQ